MYWAIKYVRIVEKSVNNVSLYVNCFLSYFRNIIVSIWQSVEIIELFLCVSNESLTFSSHELCCKLKESWLTLKFLTWEQNALKLLDTRRRELKLAIKALHASLETTTLSWISSIDDEPSCWSKSSLFEMLKWLRQLDYTVSMYTYLHHSNVINFDQRLLTSIVSISYTWWESREKTTLVHISSVSWKHTNKKLTFRRRLNFTLHRISSISKKQFE